MLTKKIILLKAVFPKWTHKFLEQKNLLFLLTFILLLAALIAYQSDPFFYKHDRKDCLAASTAYDKLLKSRESPDKLIRVINRKLFLQPKYDGFLAQNYLNQGKVSSAHVFANRTLSRTENDSPFYAEYSKNSLLIAEGNFEEALKNAKNLKKEMAGEPNLWNFSSSTVGPVLYLYNLLRIAVLEKTMQNVSEEIFAWSELENFILQSQKNPVLSKVSKKFVNTFFEHNRIDLQEYIVSRKEILNLSQ